MIYHSCKSDVVENLTSLTFGWRFVNITLTMHPTHSKLYIFVILITSRVIWYTWKVIWSILKIWPPLDPCVTPTGKGPNRPNFCQNIFWPITTFKPSITHFLQNGTWVLLPLHLQLFKIADFCVNVKKATFVHVHRFRSYQIGVRREQHKKLVKRYSETPSTYKDNPYNYVAAEVSKYEADDPFEVGDNKIRDKYYNAPLKEGVPYEIRVRAVSTGNKVGWMWQIVFLTKTTTTTTTTTSTITTTTKTSSSSSTTHTMHCFCCITVNFESL